MKNLIIVADSDPRTTVVGGVGVYASYLAENLKNKYIIKFIGKKQKESIKINLKYEVILANQKPNQNNSEFFFSLSKLAKNISSESDTIIHAQRPDWIYPFRNHKGLKIFTLHGSHYKNMKMKKGFILRYLYRYLEKKAFSIADRIISVDEETKKEYSTKYPKFSSKIKVIPVGIDTKIFHRVDKNKSRMKIGVPKNKIIFLYVGRFSKEKNIDLMIKNILHGEKLILVGSGEEETYLKKLSKGKDVDFVSPKNHKLLVNYYNSADVFLLFSDHEGLPTVVLESMACGTPVVATKVGELPRIIKNGKNGYLVSDNMRESMNLALKNSEKMMAECIKTSQLYDWKEISRQIEEVYK